MLSRWFRREAAAPRLSDLPQAIRDEVLSICRAEALAKAPLEAPDCGCLEPRERPARGRA